MKVLGVNSSPRPKGNSRYLMDIFMKLSAEKGHDTQLLDATRMTVKRCIGCGTCEKTGNCVFTDDDFTTVFLPAVIDADLLVISSPVYFYAFPADVKAIIDRTQVLWSRKYRLKTNEFKGRVRKGALLAVGATKGKDLFSGMEKTARYFFDAADMTYDGSLLFRGKDDKDEIKSHPTLLKEVQTLINDLGIDDL